MALGAYSAQYNIPQLTANQFDLICKVIMVLAPVEDITQSISSEASTTSIVIPFVRALRKHLESGNDDTDSGVRTMKKEMLDSLNRRFENVETNESLAVATLLDPCFKDKFFTGVTNRTNAKAILSTTLQEYENSHSKRNTSLEEPPSKRPKTAVIKCLADILEEENELTSESSDSQQTLGNYLSEPLVPYQAGSAFTWWNENKKRYTQLSKLAQRYLSAPPTSVPSERLFSSAGALYTESRNRLDPEKAEQLLFIKSNYDLIDGTYEFND